MGAVTATHSACVSFVSYHDGEEDDLRANGILAAAIKGSQAALQVFAAIGNLDIKHAQPDEETKEVSTQAEFEARLALTDSIYGRKVTFPGAPSKEKACQAYVDLILASTQNTPSQGLTVLHTASFADLSAIVSSAQDGQLSNATFFTYGSVNMMWGLPKGDFSDFFQHVERSGATLYLAERYPFLGDKTQYSESTAPFTCWVTEHIDTEGGLQRVNAGRENSARTRMKQAGRIKQYMIDALKQHEGDETKRLELKERYFAVIKTMGLDEGEFDINHVQEQLCTATFKDDETYTEFKQSLNALEGCLKELLAGTKNVGYVPRSFNIYVSTSLYSQVLIADQIPALMAAEKIEGRAEKGIAAQTFPVKYAGHKGKYPVYESDSRSKVHYLETERRYPDQAEQVTERNMKYIDLCSAWALLEDPSLFTDQRRAEVLGSPEFQRMALRLIEEVKNNGYALPKSVEQFKEEQAATTQM
ncbi:MAG: hypothetical protein S4CHLAM2_03510 [Chlamydiales bacterium]|nr:hypothetical protein [Chlamydiales bacterium]